MQIIITGQSSRHSDIEQDDRDRAIAAAECVLADAGVTVDAAYAEYCRQWDEFDDEAPMTGLARLWVQAGDAADVALTDGWAEPGHAVVYIAAA